MAKYYTQHPVTTIIFQCYLVCNEVPDFYTLLAKMPKSVSVKIWHLF